jgi:hypothetical protein
MASSISSQSLREETGLEQVTHQTGSSGPSMTARGFRRSSMGTLRAVRMELPSSSSASAAAATTAAAARRTRLGLVHFERASAEIGTIEGGDRGFGLGAGAHLDEPEALATTGAAVRDDIGAVDGAVL